MDQSPLAGLAGKITAITSFAKAADRVKQRRVQLFVRTPSRGLRRLCLPSETTLEASVRGVRQKASRPVTLTNATESGQSFNCENSFSLGNGHG
jgi:hypothetical protein